MIYLQNRQNKQKIRIKLLKPLRIIACLKLNFKRIHMCKNKVRQNE